MTPRGVTMGNDGATAAVEQQDTRVSAALRRTVLIADERPADRQRLAEIVAGLGHRPSVYELEDAAASISDSFQPDVAFIGYAENADRALAVIGAIAHVGICPVVAMLPEHDGYFIRAAAARGA